jgi:hypothetical protein
VRLCSACTLLWFLTPPFSGLALCSVCSALSAGACAGSCSTCPLTARAYSLLPTWVDREAMQRTSCGMRRQGYSQTQRKGTARYGKSCKEQSWKHGDLLSGLSSSGSFRSPVQLSASALPSVSPSIPALPSDRSYLRAQAEQRLRGNEARGAVYEAVSQAWLGCIARLSTPHLCASPLLRFACLFLRCTQPAPVAALYASLFQVAGQTVLTFARMYGQQNLMKLTKMIDDQQKAAAATAAAAATQHAAFAGSRRTAAASVTSAASADGGGGGARRMALGDYSTAGAVGVGGGTAADVDDDGDIELKQSRAAAKRLYDYVEVMACPSGCLNGGGQVRGIGGAADYRAQKETVRRLLQMTATATDAGSAAAAAATATAAGSVTASTEDSVLSLTPVRRVRDPNESRIVQSLYAEAFGNGGPYSSAARSLLHTSYTGVEARKAKDPDRAAAEAAAIMMSKW